MRKKSQLQCENDGCDTSSSRYRLLKCTQPRFYKNSACNGLCNNGRAVIEHFRKQNVPDAAVAEILDWI